MALIALGTADSEVSSRVARGLDRRWHDVVQTPSWDALGRLVRERPVSLLLLDVARLPADGPPALLGLRRDFPGLPLVMLARRAEPRLLFELGQARVSNLLLLDAEGSSVELGRVLARALERGVLGLVSRQLTEIVTPDALRVLRGALQLTHRCWGADRFAHSFGLSRPVLSEKLKDQRLPATGHLLLWARLLHAGYWLPDPGRSGESVSRQLEYANGAVFRRALRTWLGVTPTQLAQGGGVDLVLRAFASTQALPLLTRRASVA